MHSRRHAAGSQHNKGKYNRKHARLGNTEEKMHGWGNTDGRTRGWENTPQTAQHEKCRMETHGLRPARSHKKKAPSLCERLGAWRRRPAARCSPTLLGVVPSPRGPLTSVFGKGTGVTAPPRPPAGKSTTGSGRDERKASQRGFRGVAPEGASRVKNIHVLAPGPSASADRRGAVRASRTAYQNRSAETLAGLAHPACPPGRLPGAFSVLAHGED